MDGSSPGQKRVHLPTGWQKVSNKCSAHREHGAVSLDFEGFRPKDIVPLVILQIFA